MSVYDWKLIEKEFIYKKGETENDYIYQDQLDKVWKIVNGFDDIKKMDNNEQLTSNVISVIGERGSGKSSFLETLSYSLQDEYLVIKKIDPTAINSEMSVLELFISEIYKAVNSIEIPFRTNYDKKEILIEIKNFVDILKSLRISKSKFAEKNSGIDVFMDIEKKTTIKHSLNKVIKAFISLKNKEKNKEYKGMIFIVDDLDLVDNKNVNLMLDDIHRYFSYNVYVVLAYRQQQLFNSILDKKLVDNKELLAKNYIVDAEIFEQTAKYIEKILPVTQQVFLKINTSNAKDILGNILKDKEKNEKMESVSIENFITDKVKKYTNIEIKPIDKREATQFIFPTTLRTFLKYVQFLEGLGTITKSEPSKRVENIEKYYNYYYNKIKAELPVDLISILDVWNNVNNDMKNLTIVASLVNKMEQDNVGIDENIKIIPERQPYNVMMGDVFHVMEIFKEKYRGDISKSHLIYSLKVLYQAKLLLALENYRIKKIKNT